MPEGTNTSNLDQRRERASTRLDEATELDFHRSELVSLEEVRARREALGAAAFTKTPLEKERLSDLAIEGIVRSGAWIEYVRKDYRDRHWNLDEREAA